MTAFRALQVYEEVLRGLQKNLSHSGDGVESVLESGFSYLCERLKIQSMGLFWWDTERNSFDMEYAYYENTLLESEEEIIVESNSPLWFLVKQLKPVVISKKKPWVAYIPLVFDGKLVGAIRIRRDHPLPKGDVLKSIPRLNGEGSTDGRNFPFLEDIGDIFSVKLREAIRDLEHIKRAQSLQAGAEVATVVVETPRLGDMLETVAKSIVKNLGFDRIRFYLVDSVKSELHGVSGLQIPGRVLNLKNETFTLVPNTNSLVDAVLKGSNDLYSVTAGGKVVYVPLGVGGQVIGCIAVDNLLSQQVIDKEQITSLKSLAGQIGMAVLNARLFEDIEQQAITDGLTKLYVYRYFQQRLKEELDRADRYSYSVALIMIDVDNFKKLNDNFGHPMGDKVLEFLSQHIRGNIRRIDLAARYGGDEFVLLLPEITEQEAWLMGSRLLNTLKQNPLRSLAGDPVPMSITLGVALYPTDAANGRDLIEAADRALYWAKKNNKGDLCFFKTISTKPTDKSAERLA